MCVCVCAVQEGTFGRKKLKLCVLQVFVCVCVCVGDKCVLTGSSLLSFRCFGDTASTH